MRKLLVAGTTGLVIAIAVAAVALASATAPTVTVHATVSPSKAGTPRHPQGVTLNTVINWESLGSASQPIVTDFFVLFPKGSLYNGARYPKCSEATLNGGGPGVCPAGSIMGHGTGDAYADQTITHPQITVVNGGANRVYFYTVLNNPARVQQAVVGKISKMGGKWAYSLSVHVPNNLQVVAGVPIELTHLSVTAGRASWLASTRCSGGHWPYQVTTSYSTGGQSTATSAVACH